MKLEDFFIGQRVKQFDEDENCNVYGHVKRIEGKSVWILWNDMPEEIEHIDETDLATISHGVNAFRL